MDYDKIVMDGRLNLEILNGLLGYTALDKGRIFYDNISHAPTYGNSVRSDWNNLVDIPKDSIILIDSDTSIIGYNLLIGQDDDVVYITSGSSNGGEPGRTAKSDGQWEHSPHYHSMQHAHAHISHDHTLNAHSHTITGHGHQWLYYASAGYTYSWNINNTLLRVQDYGTLHGFGFIVTVSNSSDPASIVGHRYTEAIPSAPSGNANVNTGGVSGNSDNTTTLTTSTGQTPTEWRPLGRNFTRQQRAE